MKKIISTLLVVALLLTVLTVGIATTSAAETASITIYGLDGSTETKEVNVGDTFTVYTTLDVTDSVSDGKVGSIEGKQTYTSSILSLVDQITGQYGEIADRETVFPITGNTTMSNAATAGTIYYNASMPSGGFKFDTAYSKLIVTTYKVKTAGNAEVKNALTNLAAADTAMTKIVYKGQLQTGMSIDGTATFDDPVPEIDYAHVTIYKLDGTTEEKDFDIGDTFTVYTMLNVSASVADGKVGSINGVQKYSSDKLELENPVSNGEIADLDDTFPITKKNTVTNCKTAGMIKYAASSSNGFLFSDDNCQLIKTNYSVTANGFAEIRNSMIVLAAADEDATRIVFGGETQPGKSYSMPASFYPPGEAPTEAPTEPGPTVIPTEPAPTDAPTESGPTETPAKLDVTIIGVNGSQTVKSYSVGDEFPVYTMLDISGTLPNGQVADVDGSQTFAADKLQLTDATEGEYNEIVNKTAMFPILGGSAVASCNNGTIKFNATKPDINNGFLFNSDKCKLIVTNYKVLAGGTATIETSLKTLVGADADVTKIVYKGVNQPGTSYSMYESFTDPAPEPVTEPATQPVTEPATQPVTEPATQPATQPVTEAPTEAPADKAVITIYDINGNSTQKTFGIGDTFTVYTSFDVSETIENGMISSISASQTFSTDVLETADDIDSIGIVQNTTEMFPVFGAQATAKIDAAAGTNKYNASTPYIGNGFVFNSDECLLIVTKYTVTAAGTGEIRNVITTCAAADAALTRLVSKGVIQPGVVLNNTTSFYPPDYEPTEPPTEPPVTTADITIYGIDGTSETKTFNIGETFTVYTTFDASEFAKNGISSIAATQTFSTDVLESADTVDRSYIITDTATVFPILGNSAVARVGDGIIKYNASKADIDDGFPFNDASDLLIVTKYTVIAGGTGEVRNAITTCVDANADLTRWVDKGVPAAGVELVGSASFTEPEPVGVTFLLGDADDDDDVAVIDATWVQRYVANYPLPSNLDEDILVRNGDVDDSGDIEITDATFIQRYVAGYPVNYPIGEYITR